MKVRDCASGSSLDDSHAWCLTCLGLVDSPGEEAPLGDSLFGLVLRLAAEEVETVESTAAEEWPLVQSYEQERDESLGVSLSPFRNEIIRKKKQLNACDSKTKLTRSRCF
jgi:hypothetical protein